MKAKKTTKRTLKKTAPVPSKCNFFVADDIRLEQGGKPTLLGFYPDGKLELQLPKGMAAPTTERPIGLATLAILANFVGASGEYTLDLELFGANNQSLMKGKEAKLVGDARNINFVARFAPFAINGFGTYRLVLRVDKTEFKFSFDVTQSESNAPELGFLSLEHAVQAPPKKKRAR